MFYIRIKDKFSHYAHRYDEIVAKSNYNIPHKLATMLSQRFNQEAQLKILDVGCGTGLLTSHIKDYYPNAHSTGLDYSENMLREARFRFHNPTDETIQIDLSQDEIPFPDGTFDLVVSSGASEYIGNKAHLIAEIGRVAKQGGQILSTFMRKDLQHLKYAATSVVVSFLSFDGNKNNASPIGYSTTKNSLLKTFEKNSMEVKGIEKARAYNQINLHTPNYLIVDALKL
ncbi:MAG: class I SAM-dependent methyltransferase [Pseudomonadota bacterium]